MTISTPLSPALRPPHRAPYSAPPACALQQQVMYSELALRGERGRSLRPCVSSKVRSSCGSSQKSHQASSRRGRVVPQVGTGIGADQWSDTASGPVHHRSSLCESVQPSEPDIPICTAFCADSVPSSSTEEDQCIVAVWYLVNLSAFLAQCLSPPCRIGATRAEPSGRSRSLGRSHERLCLCLNLPALSCSRRAPILPHTGSQLQLPSCTMLSSLARSAATRSSRASLAAVTGSPALAARSYGSTLLRTPRLAAAAPPSSTRASLLHSSSRLARDDAAATEAPPQPQAGGLENQGQEAVPSPMTEQARRSDDIDVCAVVSPPWPRAGS